MERRGLLVLLLFAAALAQNTLTLQAVLRDFTPSHPDFEHYLGDGRGAVLKTLDVDGKPQLNPDPNTWSGVFTGPTYFAEWYRDTPGVSFIPSFVVDLVFTETAPGSGIFEYNNQNYFPLDGKGFGDYLGYGHNFHFTTEVHTKFTYLAGQQTFSFCGDDDLFVYVNGYLIMDLGGVHSAECNSVNLDDVATLCGLTNGSLANLDMFGAERHTVASTIKIDTSIILVSKPVTPPPPGRTTYLCGVKFDNYGVGATGPVPAEPSFTVFGNYGFDNFNAISFDGFYVPTGDIQGRLAVRNAFKTTNGYSVGIEINSGGASAVDKVLPYSLVVGGNAEFDIGSIFPDGSNQAHFSQQENAFVGGTFTAPAYLQARRTGGPAPGALNGDFDNAQAYYRLLSSELAAVADNVQYVVQYDGVTFTCNDNSGNYFVTIPAATFNTIRYYNTPVGCNTNAQYVINVPGGDVTFGDDFARFVAPEYLVYNFPGTGRTINSQRFVSGSILAPDCTLDQPIGTIQGIVIAGNVKQSLQINRLFCPAHPPPVIASPVDILCPYFETECQGLLLPLGNKMASMRDFNVVSFGDFNDVSGDVEGRLAVGGNLDVMHFSVGAELQTFNGPDADLPYAVVVGGDAAWTDGSIWPDGSNVPYPGNAEGIYVGGTFTAPPYLAARRSGPGSLATWFAGARQCYNTFSQAFANTPDNVVQSIQYGGLLLQCNDAKAARYTVTVPDTTFNTITYYTLDNCNFQASWVINIGGNGPVQFYGGSFPAVTGGLVYNVLGSGRVINVTGTGVTGHILSPWNSISQTASVIKGKVVVGSFLTAVQVNKPVCNKSPPVTVMTAAAQDTPAGSTSLNVISNALIAGDSANVGGTFLTVVSSNNKVLKFNAPLPSAVSAGSFVTTVVNDTTASRATPIPATTPTVKNGGASFEIFAALLVALLAFAL